MNQTFVNVQTISRTIGSVANPFYLNLFIFHSNSIFKLNRLRLLNEKKNQNSIVELQRENEKNLTNTEKTLSADIKWNRMEKLSRTNVITTIPISNTLTINRSVCNDFMASWNVHGMCTIRSQRTNFALYFVPDHTLKLFEMSTTFCFIRWL